MACLQRLGPVYWQEEDRRGMNIDVEPGSKPKLLGPNSSTEMTQLSNKSTVATVPKSAFPDWRAPARTPRLLMPHRPLKIILTRNGPPHEPFLCTASMSLDTDVVIVGGGPVGLVIALLLARDGIRVTVGEANGEVNPSPRAAAYGAAAVDV